MRLPDPLPLLSMSRVIPVLTIEREADAVPLASALVAGGLRVIEVTLRTSVALRATEAIARSVPEAIVGVGTVTAAADVGRAIAAGARYLVCPGTSPALAQALQEAEVPALPGCSTVSEAMMLAELGFRLLKFFPAEACGGIAWLKAVAAPLPELRFCPTGGIGQSNVAAYLAVPNVVAVGGSWVAPNLAVAAGDFAHVTELARLASASQTIPAN